MQSPPQSRPRRLTRGRKIGVCGEHHALAALPPEKKARVDPRVVLDRCGKSRPHPLPPGLHHRTVLFIGSHYIDYAIPVLKLFSVGHIELLA